MQFSDGSHGNHKMLEVSVMSAHVATAVRTTTILNF